METSKAGTGSKRKRVVLTLKQKIEICQRLEKGEKRSQIMNEFNIGSSTIYDIKHQKEELLKFYTSSESSRSADKRRTLKKPKLEELDRVLYEWFALKRLQGVPMTGTILIEKAKEFYTKLQLTESCAFSEGWLTCFKLRHGIRHLDMSGKNTAADCEAAGSYCDHFAKIVAEHGLSPDQIYNADETGLFWRCLPESVLAGSGEASAAGFKKNKDRITVLVCANAAGTHQIKLFVVGKSKNPCAFKNLRHLPVRYSAQSNSWMDVQLFTHWFHYIFVPSVKQHFRKNGKPEDSKCILLLDNCRAHPPESKLVSGNIFVIYLPPKVTALIQPMDQGIIENLKCHYRKDFLRKLLSNNEKITEFQKAYSLKDAVYNLACAWKLVKPQTLRRAWHKLWPNTSGSQLLQFSFPFTRGCHSIL
ncbi:jerky protein homolog isoform X2 [Rhincodon typus]|uniref:jerky protein homolog isoform X2 n=1 Tax=Rhincodon typus TaxID=259920 RepID=UPI00202F0BB8|nr:jerky protein homolog isoform X2 [Rhincodon typus]